MADEPVSEDEYEACLRPREALDRVRLSFSNLDMAGAAILDRLKGGLVRSVAKSSSWGEGGTPTGRVRIPAKHWSHQTGKSAAWWISGDIRCFIPSIKGPHYHIPSSAIRYYGVRFEADGIVGIVRDTELRPAPLDSATAVAVYGYQPHMMDLEPELESPLETGEPKRPISDATLKAWWGMCLTIRPTDAWNADQMQAFFDQCFPNKSVSRDRMRKVRPKPKSGPKAHSAE